MKPCPDGEEILVAGAAATAFPRWSVETSQNLSENKRNWPQINVNGARTAADGEPTCDRFALICVHLRQKNS